MPTFGDLTGTDRTEFAQQLAKIVVTTLEEQHMKPKEANDNAALAVFSSTFYCEAYEKGFVDESAITQVRTGGHYQSQVLMEMLLKYREMAEESTKYALDCRKWIALQWALEPWAAVARMMQDWVEKKFLEKGSPFDYLPVHKAHMIAIMKKEDEEEGSTDGEEDNEEESDDDDIKCSSSEEEGSDDEDNKCSSEEEEGESDKNNDDDDDDDKSEGEKAWEREEQIQNDIARDEAREALERGELPRSPPCKKKKKKRYSESGSEDEPDSPSKKHSKGAHGA